MGARRSEVYAEVYSIIKRIAVDELGETNLTRAKAYVAESVGREKGTIDADFSDKRPCPDSVLEAFADYLAARPKNTTRTRETILAEIMAPIAMARRTGTDTDTVPLNLMPKPRDHAAELAQMEIMLAGHNRSQESGTAMDITLCVRETSVDVDGEGLFCIKLKRCWVRLDLISVWAERGTARVIADQADPGKKLKLAIGEGVPREKQWKLEHDEESETIEGTFEIELCRLSGRPTWQDSARFVTKACCLRIADKNGTVVDEEGIPIEADRVRNALIAKHKLSVDERGYILLTSQQLGPK